MAKTKKLLSLLVVLAMAVTMLSGITAVSADGETITLKAPKRTVGIGEKIQIPVVLNQADGLTGFDIDVKWDPAMLEMSSVESEAVTLPDVVSATAPVINMDLVSDGEIVVSAASARGIALTGKAVIATLNFKILAVGNITLSFDTDYTTLSISGSDTPVTAVGCTFTSEDNRMTSWNAPYATFGSTIAPDAGSKSTKTLAESEGYNLPTAATAEDVSAYPGVREGVMKFEGKSNIVSNVGTMFSKTVPLSMDGYHMVKAGFNIYIPKAEKSDSHQAIMSFANESTTNASTFTITFQDGAATVAIKGLDKVSANNNISVPTGKWVNCYVTAAFEKDSSKPTYTLVIDGTAVGVYTDGYNRAFATYAYSQIKTLSDSGIYFMDNIEVRAVKIAEEPEDVDFAIKGYSFIMEERTDDEALAYAEKVAAMGSADLCSSKRNCVGGDEGKLYTIDVEVSYQNNTDTAKSGTVVIACASDSKSSYPSAVYAQDVTFEPTNGSTGTVRTTLKLKGLDHNVKSSTQEKGHKFTQLKAYVVSGANTLAPLGDASLGSYETATAPGVLWSTAVEK